MKFSSLTVWFRVFVFGALLLSRPAMSADASDVTRQKILKMLEITKTSAAMDQMAGSMMNAVVQGVADSAAKEGKKVNPEALEVVKEEATSLFREHLPELTDKMVDIYAKFFTADEIDQMIVFYQTPVGQKAVSVMPQIMQDSLQIGMQWGQGLAPELNARIQKRLKKSGIKMAV